MHLWNAVLSLCGEPERGHTHLHTDRTLLKCPPLSSWVPLPLHAHTHTHTTVCAAGVRLSSPIGIHLCSPLICSSVWRTRSHSGPPKGWSGGRCLLVLLALPRVIPHHLSFSSHMFFFCLFCCSLPHEKSPMPPKVSTSNTMTEMC